MPVSVNVTFVMLPARPETVMFDGYGLAAVGGVIPSTMVIAAGFEKTTCGASGAGAPVCGPPAATLRVAPPLTTVCAKPLWATIKEQQSASKEQQSASAVKAARLERERELIFFSLRVSVSAVKAERAKAHLRLVARCEGCIRRKRLYFALILRGVCVS